VARSATAHNPPIVVRKPSGTNGGGIPGFPAARPGRRLIIVVNR